MTLGISPGQRGAHPDDLTFLLKVTGRLATTAFLTLLLLPFVEPREEPPTPLLLLALPMPLPRLWARGRPTPVSPPGRRGCGQAAVGTGEGFLPGAEALVLLAGGEGAPAARLMPPLGAAEASANVHACKACDIGWQRQ